MTDYLKIYEKFKDVKEVKDYIDDVILLRHYYATQQYAQMQDHIRKLTIEYPVEALVWNVGHRISDAIQPSHPLSFPSSPAPNPSQHQSLFQ